jgi:hypothetical protein
VKTTIFMPSTSMRAIGSPAACVALMARRIWTAEALGARGITPSYGCGDLLRRLYFMLPLELIPALKNKPRARLTLKMARLFQRVGKNLFCFDAPVSMNMRPGELQNGA